MSILQRLAVRVRRFICWIGGHDMLTNFDDGRMSLKCACGHETPGWDCIGRMAMDGRKPAAARDRQVVVRMNR